MDDDHNQSGHPTRRNNDVNLLYQAEHELTGEDAVTVIGICISLLVMLIGALVCIVCCRHLTLLLQIWLHLLTSSSNSVA